MKNKELKNLTPAMVEELRELGVMFRDTEQVYRIQKYKLPEVNWYKDFRDNRLKDNERELFGEHNSERIISAPNLQEVIDKLPKMISTEYINWYLELSYRNNIICYAAWGEISEDLMWFQNTECLLTSCFELLKWVATNHPDTLKGGSDE